MNRAERVEDILVQYYDIDEDTANELVCEDMPWIQEQLEIGIDTKIIARSLAAEHKSNIKV